MIRTPHDADVSIRAAALALLALVAIVLSCSLAVHAVRSAFPTHTRMTPGQSTMAAPLGELRD